MKDDHAKPVKTLEKLDARIPNPASTADEPKMVSEEFAETKDMINGKSEHSRLVDAIETCKNELYLPRTDNLPERTLAIGNAYRDGLRAGLSHKQIAKNILAVKKEYEG